jgi:anti-anti-sigma factor
MFAAAADCQLEVERGPEWLLVRVRQLERPLAGSAPLAEQLWGLLQQHFTYRLVLELDQIPVLDSQLIGQLILLSKRLEDRDGVLRLCGLTPYNRRVLHQCALEDRFPAFDSRHEAVLGDSDPRLPR